MKETYVKLYRKLSENPISSNLELLGFFSYLLLNVNYKEGSFYLGMEKIILKPGQILTSQRKLADKFGVNLSKINRMIKVLQSEGILKQIKNTKYTLLELNKWGKYQGSETLVEQKGNTNETLRETYKEELRIIKNNKEYNNLSNDKLENETFSDYEKNSGKDFEKKEKTKLKEKVCNENESVKSSAENLEVAEVEKVKYGNKEINQILSYLQQVIGISDFKESRQWERRYAKHLLDLGKKIGKDDFNFRLQSILEDEFKAKNCNSIKFLYGELKSFIHSPVVETREKNTKAITFG